VDSKERLIPAEVSWETDPPVKPGENGQYACPIPGVTKFI